MGKDEMTAGECRMRTEVQVHTDGNERYNYKYVAYENPVKY